MPQAPQVSPNDNLQRLIRNSGLLADISFADILILTPKHGGGNGREGETEHAAFEVAGQARPINSSTAYPNDLTGRTVLADERPLAAQSFTKSQIADGGTRNNDVWLRSLAVPVKFGGSTIAVLLREYSPYIFLPAGSLEANYFSTFKRLAKMIAEGIYPFPMNLCDYDHPPRVGDGLMMLNRDALVEYVSPNAMSALRRVGIEVDPVGKCLNEEGLGLQELDSAFDSGLSFIQEVEKHNHTIVFLCIPLISEGEITGALVLLRDITELRRQDQLLLVKDATIAETHHRVKNNLQTISSLLQIQSRRLLVPEAKNAIAESVRRIRSIAVVHEILSEKATDEVEFEEILQSLLMEVQKALVVPDSPVKIKVSGSVGVIPSNLATSLSVVLSEIIQNAIDHAFGEAFDEAGADPKSSKGNSRILISFKRGPAGLDVQVEDNGVGLADDFSFNETKGMGLMIVKTLIEKDLGGSISIGSKRDNGKKSRGTSIHLSIPLG